jgi:hypothetical protein
MGAGHLHGGLQLEPAAELAHGIAKARARIFRGIDTRFNRLHLLLNSVAWGTADFICSGAA